MVVFIILAKSFLRWICIVVLYFLRSRTQRRISFQHVRVILKIQPKSYFHEGRRMSSQRNFDTPPKNWGIFRVVPPRHGRTQRRIYNLFLEVLWFVRLLYDRE